MRQWPWCVMSPPHENIVVFAGNTTLFERARREIAGDRVIQLDPWLHLCRNAPDVG